jgi:hypothetical protein
MISHNRRQPNRQQTHWLIKKVAAAEVASCPA